MSLANFKISEGLNIKGLVLDNNSGTLTWDGDNIATEGYVTTAIGNISIPPAYITSVGSNLSVTGGELDLGANVVITDATQTLSNKTLASPTITVGSSTTTSFSGEDFIVTDNNGDSNKKVISSASGLDFTVLQPSSLTITGSFNNSADGTYSVASITSATQLILTTAILPGQSLQGVFAPYGGAPASFTFSSGSTTTVSATEISYLDGVTSNIQTQLDGKLVSSDLSGYLTSSDASSTYQTQSGLDTAVSGLGYITSSALSGYATETYVGSQGFLLSSDLSGYATETYVGSQGFLTSADLSGYATETYVGNQGFITTSGQYIQSVGSNLSVTSNELNVDLTSKQDALTAGTYITITGSTIDVDTTTIATKAYVDATAQGLNVKNSVLVATTEAIDVLVSATSVVDGVTLSDGDRVLVKDQADASQNGIYTYNSDGISAVYNRTLDETTPAKGDFVFVESGTANAKTGWILGNSTTEWTQFSAAGEYTAGSNISLSGNVIAVQDAPTFNNPTLTVGSSVGTLNIYSDSNTGPIWWGLTRGVVSISASAGAYITGPITSNGTYTVTISGATGTYASLINGTHTAVVDGMYLAGPDFITFTDITDAGFLAYLPTIEYSSAARTANLLGNDVVVNVGGLLTISSTEISHLDGVTSNIQTQLDAKQDTLASTTDVSVKTVTTQNADGVSSKVVAFGNTTDTTYAMGSDVTVGTLDAATKATDIFLQILDNSGNSRTSKLTAVFNGGSAPIWTEYGVVDSGTIINATVSFDGSKHIIVNVTGSGTYAVRGTATSLL